MKLTSVMPVSASTMRNVVRIDAAATSSGTRASRDPNTKASTTSAPTAPITRLGEHSAAGSGGVHGGQLSDAGDVHGRSGWKRG